MVTINSEFIKDSECTRLTPLLYGYPDENIYGAGQAVVPRLPGKQNTKYEQKIYLPELLPLEDYDLIIVLFSGGKDSTAAFYRLIELGVPKSKIELWHHDLDGGHPSRIMDWPVTKPYVRSFAEAENVSLQISQRVNGFWGEVYRIGSPYPIEYEQDGKMKTCALSKNQEQSESLRRRIMESLSDIKLPDDSAALSRLWCSVYEEKLLDEMLSYDLKDLGRFGYVGKLPAKSSIANGRWCSFRCKKEVSDAVIKNIFDLKKQAFHLRLPQKRAAEKGRFCTGRCKNDVGDNVIRSIFELKQQGGHLRLPAKSTIEKGRYCSSVGKEKVFAKTICTIDSANEGIKILVVSGERRGESANRAKYNEMELSSCNATVKGNRLVHHWRAVIDYSERDVWEVLSRNHCVPHPCYAIGWNRCSCALCIFSKREQWAGIRELFPELYEQVRQDEIRLGFTLNVYKTLDEYVGDAESCVYHGDQEAMRQMLGGEFSPEEIHTDDWKYPAGAFNGSEGGPC